MKRIRLLALSLLAVAIGVPSAMAQRGGHKAEEYTPTIYMIAVGEELQNYDPEVVRVAIIEDFVETKRCGFQQAHNPQFIFSTRNNRFNRRDLRRSGIGYWRYGKSPYKLRPQGRCGEYRLYSIRYPYGAKLCHTAESDDGCLDLTNFYESYYK